MATRPKSIRAEDETWNRLQRVVDARGYGENVNQVVVALIEEFLAEEEADLARALTAAPACVDHPA